MNGGAMYAREPVPDSYERDARVGVPIGPRMKPNIGDFSRLVKTLSNRMLHYSRYCELQVMGL